MILGNNCHLGMLSVSLFLRCVGDQVGPLRDSTGSFLLVNDRIIWIALRNNQNQKGDGLLVLLPNPMDSRDNATKFLEYLIPL